MYYGTMAIEGLAAPGNYYSPFIDKHLDCASWLRMSLLSGSKIFLALIGYKTVITDVHHLQMYQGVSVQLVYACLGVGVMSFWNAFVFANRGSWKRKLAWMLGGTLMLWLINVLRISLVLLANNKQWSIPLGWDHHTWFNIIAYIFIFVLIYLYDRNLKKNLQESPSKNA